MDEVKIIDGLFEGWKITEEQKRLINRRDRTKESKAAFEKFFDENFLRLYYLAKRVLFNHLHNDAHGYLKSFIFYGKITPNSFKKDYNEFARKVLCAPITVTERTVFEIEDLLNSFYTDYLNGYIIFKFEPHYITGIICRSFRYAAVGGVKGLREYKQRRI